MCRESWAGISYTPQYLAYEVMETSAGPLWKCFSDILSEVYIYLPGFNLQGVSSFLPPTKKQSPRHGVPKTPPISGTLPPWGAARRMGHPVQHHIYISKTIHLQSDRLVYPLAGEHYPHRCSLALTTEVASRSSVVFPTCHRNLHFTFLTCLEHFFLFQHWLPPLHFDHPLLQFLWNDAWKYALTTP